MRWTILFLALMTVAAGQTSRPRSAADSDGQRLTIDAQYRFKGNDLSRPFDVYQFKDTVTVRSVHVQYQCANCGVVLVAIQDLEGKPICAPLVMNGSTGPKDITFSVNSRPLAAIKIAVASLDDRPGANLKLHLEALPTARAGGA